MAATQPVVDLQVAFQAQGVSKQSNPGFDLNTNGWLPSGTNAIARVTTVFHDGPAAGQITWATGAAGANSITAPPVTGLTPGAVFVVSAWLWGTTGQTRLQLCADNGSGGSFVAGPIAAATSSWQWVQFQYTVPASGTIRAVIQNADATTSGQISYVDTMAVGALVSANPNDPTITPVYTSLSHRLVSFLTKVGKRYELDQATSEEGEAKLRNTDGALDPTNTSSLYYPNVLPFRQAQIVVTPPSMSPVTIWTGFIEAWTQSWDKHGAYGWVTARLVDALTPLSQIILNSCLASEFLLDSPYGYWQLGEPSSATAGANSAASLSGTLTQVQVGVGGTCGFGGTTLTALVGAGATDGTTGPIQGNTTGVLLTPASATQGIYLATNVATNDGQVELAVVFQTTGTSECIVTQSTGTVGNTVGFHVDATGHLAVNYGGILYSTTKVVNDGAEHIVEFNGNSPANVYIDGTAYATGIGVTWSISASGNPTFTQLYVGANPIVGIGNGAGMNLFSGTIAHVASLPVVTSTSRAAVHSTAAFTAFSGEDSGARFARVLKYAPWNGPKNVPAGANLLQGATALAGKSALAALLNVVDAEQSNMYVSRAGEVTFENRQARYKQLTPAWTLGENTGELPYEEGVTVDFDPSQVFNTAQVIRPAGVIVNDSDAASALAYFIRSYPQTPLVLPVTDDNTAIAAAQYLIGRYKNPQARLAGAEFRPSRNPNLWTFATTAKIGDRVHLNRRTSQGAPTVSLDLFIESIGYSWDAQTADLSFSVEASPAFWQAYGILTAQRGTLNAGVSGGATSIAVLVPTDAAGNTPAQNGWTKSAMPSVQIVDGANTETVTVSAISIAGQIATLTVSALAHPHSSGVTVAENPGSYTYNQFDSAAALDGAHQLGY